MEKPKIYLGCDHGGYTLKALLIDYLIGQDYEVQDFGCHSEDIVRYPYYAEKVVKAVRSVPSARGVLLCTTGIGMSIFANKFKGIRAALCTTSYQARMTAAHNNSNILCFGGRCIGLYEAQDMLHTWLTTPYEGGRHDISLGLIQSAEDINFSAKEWEGMGSHEP
ncbi:ribose 5-phosphate isomerase B [Salmonirosea aquatica]|uniref:Ribose 5-phosphate isomerase B n=1 Tax=Salmonirosea aquatica TaxID=2654236 RepID=A0A7C9BBV7_9BACT|nr:ribose 5-phosphate isomerase B [Cytophagaceae bacterium SJW1-29]